MNLLLVAEVARDWPFVAEVARLWRENPINRDRSQTFTKNLRPQVVRFDTNDPHDAVRDHSGSR